MTRRKLSEKAQVGFGLLIRNRRLAEAVLLLGERHAYEGRMLLRSMIELRINWEWIRIGKGNARARRFLRFDPIERLQISTDISSVLPADKAKASLARLASERAATKHLFRARNAKGKLVWRDHWASVPSLRDRYLAVQRSEGGASDAFIYGIYRWSSSAVHGGPVSLAEMITTRGNRLIIKRQPETAPTAQISAASVVLGAMLTQITKESRLVRVHRKEVVDLVRMLRAPQATPRKSPRAAS